MGQVILLSEQKKLLAPPKSRIELTPTLRAEIEELGIILFYLADHDAETQAIMRHALRQCGPTSVPPYELEVRRRMILATIEALLSKAYEYKRLELQSGTGELVLDCLKRFKQIRADRAT